MGSRWSLRRRSCVNRPRAGLRRNHSALRDNRLSRRWLGRSRRCWRTGCCLRRRSRSFWLCRRRCNCCCGRMRGRRNNHGRRRCGFFRSRGRRNYGRRLSRRRRDHSGLFRLRRSRFRRNNGCRLLRCRSRRCGRSCRFLRSRSCRLYRGCRRRGRRPRWRLLLLLLSFPEQLGDVARLGDLGEIDLRLHFRGSRSLFGSRAGFRRKVLPHPFRFILLKRA